MKYDFDKKTNRIGIESYKWDKFKDIKLPMWVADMDFECAPKIVDAIKARVETKIYGYTLTGTDYYKAFANWWNRRHNAGYDYKKMCYSIGVVASISSIIRTLTKPYDKIAILSPVYNHFFMSIESNSREILDVPLIQNGFDFQIDYELLDKALKDAKLMIMCNPHNPVGRIWTKDELKRVGELAEKNNVVVISDEIHCDVVTPGYKYSPYVTASESCRNNSICLMSTSKVFNMAGIHASTVYIENDVLREKVFKGLEATEIADNNYFSIDANVVALNECEDWADEVNEYIYQNKILFKKLLDEKLPHVKYEIAHATYLAWVDFNYYSNDDVFLRDDIAKKVGVYFSCGSDYGNLGKGYFRINLATNRDNIKKCVELLVEYFK